MNRRESLSEEFALTGLASRRNPEPLAYAQLCQERKMIGCHPGQRVPNRPGIDHFDGFRHEDMIETQNGCSRMKSRLRLAKGIGELGILHPVCNQPVGP